MSFVTVFVIVLLAVCALGAAVLAGAYAIGIGPVRQKHAREAAKLAVDLLRAQRLARDLEVVDARAHKLNNDVVLGDMKIEVMRHQMQAAGLLDKPSGTDSPSW